MNPYMSFLLEPFVQSLKSFHAGNLDNQAYWTGIIQTLTKSFMFDDGGLFDKLFPESKINIFLQPSGGMINFAKCHLL